MKLYNEENIKEIANSIREKNGKSDEYKLREMPNAIRELPSVEEYQDLVQNSFTNDFEGSEGIIEDTAKARVVDMKVKGDIQQDSYEGYNIIDPSIYAVDEGESTTNNGITLTNLGDGYFKINGTATANAFLPITKYVFSVENEQQYTMYLNNDKTTLSSQTYVRISVSGLGNFRVSDFSKVNNIFTTTSTITSDSSRIELRVNSGEVFDNLTIRPMLIKGSDQTKPYEPYVGGTSSPNINYPQEIKVVDGNYDFVFTNRNLVKIDNTNLGHTNSTEVIKIPNGYRAICRTGSPYIFNIYKLKDVTDFVGKTVYFKANMIASANNKSRFTIGLCDENGQNRKSMSLLSESGEGSFVIPELTEAKYLAVYLYSNSASTSGIAKVGDYVDYTDLYVGISDGNKPYIPNENQTFSLDMHNRNELDLSKITEKLFINVTTGSESQPDTWNQSDYIPVKNGENIAITNDYLVGNNSFEINFYDENKVWKQGEQFSMPNEIKKYTSTVDGYIRVGYRNDRVNVNTLMIARTDKFLSYVPYTEPYKYTAYKDSYFRRKGYKDFELVNLWKQIRLTSTMSWQKTSYAFSTQISNQSIKKAYCTHFNVASKSWTSSDLSLLNKFTVTNTLGTFKCMPFSESVTTDVWRNYLNENEIYLVYQLAEPEITPITNEILNSQLEEISKTKMYEGGTNIIITGDEALPILNPNYIVSKNYIQSAMLLAEPEIGG